MQKTDLNLPFLKSKVIIGSIAGDIIGSVYEWKNPISENYDLFSDKSKFTDDTVLTIAVVDSILNHKDFAHTLKEYGNKYKHRGYGGRFKKWLKSSSYKPYRSYGNGSAMRVSPIGVAYNNLNEVLSVAKQTAAVTHNNPEGIKGAQAIASAIFFAYNGADKKEIKQYITQTFGYNLDFTIKEIKNEYTFDATCQGSVPQAIVSFLDSKNFEDAVRLAISLGGDSDTLACMTGGIASAFYKYIPTCIFDVVLSKLPDNFIKILNKFDEKF